MNNKELAPFLEKVNLKPLKEDIKLNEECIKFPLEKIATLGIAFKPVVSMLGKKGKSGLYYVTVPKGMSLLKSGEAFIGGAAKNGVSGIAGQAKLVKCVNPAMICVAIVVATIDNKIAKIVEGHKEILQYFSQKEQAQLKGNVKALEKMLADYKYNWDNQGYITSSLTEVQSIKRDALKDLEFFKIKVEEIINKNKSLHGEKWVKEKIKNFEKAYKNYQYSLYVYAQSYFLEVLLLENYQQEFLTSVLNDINNEIQISKDLYRLGCCGIEGFSKTSLETKTTNVLSSVSKGLGNFIAKIPVVSKGTLDEGLIEGAEKLAEKSKKKTKKVLDKISVYENGYLNPFIDNLQLLSLMYNQETKVITDGENVYLKPIK